MTAIKPVVFSIDDIDDIDDIDNAIDICRDECCPIIEIHEAHAILPSARGRAPKCCPTCFKPIPKGQGPRCLVCGWNRRNSTISAYKKGKSNA